MESYYWLFAVIGVTLLLIVLFLLLTKKRKLKDTNKYQQIDLKTFKNLIETKGNLVILDVRTKAEREKNKIPNSILVESVNVKRDIEKIVEDKNTPIVVYCASGGRSRASALTLSFLGYTTVYDFGSINKWKE